MPNRNLLSFYSCERVQNDNIIFLFRNKERNKISINYSPPKHLITLARPKTSSVFSHFIVHQAPTYKDLLTALRTAAVLLGAGILSLLPHFFHVGIHSDLTSLQDPLSYCVNARINLNSVAVLMYSVCFLSSFLGPPVVHPCPWSLSCPCLPLHT